LGDTQTIEQSEICSDAQVESAATTLQRLGSRQRFIACVQACDFILSFLFGLVWFEIVAGEGAEYWYPAHVLIAILAAVTVICVFHCFRLYDFTVLIRGRTAAVRAFIAGVISFTPFLAPLLARQDIAFHPVNACYAIVVGFAGVGLARLAIARAATALRRTVVGNRIYIIAGSPTSAGVLRSMLARSPDNRIVGSWSLSANLPVEQALEGALSFLRTHPVDLVILSLPLAETDRLMEAARVLRSTPFTVLFALNPEGSDDFFLRSNSAGPDGLGNLAVIKLSERPLAGWLWVVKDVQDRALALLILTFISPVMLIIMVAIKLADPGPIFFRQKRFGYATEPFDILKFRTMRVAVQGADSEALKLTTRDDPRIFPLGRMLRKTSLDELPQLLNVLFGDMWIVGPRPHSPHARAGGEIYAKAVREYAARYRIKPGITGWAQVCGWRGPTETLEQLNGRVQHDLYYIENWSMLFDLKILFKTLTCAFTDENAF
jgi:Undecaprenyl-phosphate glucose phosphotransferase